ncbi:MAG: hypothetical protein ACLTR6_03370, partial [Clostridium fessum]
KVNRERQIESNSTLDKISVLSSTVLTSLWVEIFLRSDKRQIIYLDMYTDFSFHDIIPIQQQYCKFAFVCII